MNVISCVAKPGNTSGIHGQGTIHPAGQRAGVALSQVMTAGQHGNTTARFYRQLQDLVRQEATGMNGHDKGPFRNGGILEAGVVKLHPAGKPGPVPLQLPQDTFLAERSFDVDARGAGRCVVQNEQNCREQSVAGRQFDNRASTHLSTDAPGRFPGLEEFFARQTFSLTHYPGNSHKERVPGKPTGCVPVENTTG